MFQDRFKSEPVENDNYTLCAARYIHQNPIKAGMVKEIGKYRWSSYEAYLNDKVSIIDTDFILARLGEKAEYAKFMNQEEDKKLFRI